MERGRCGYGQGSTCAKQGPVKTLKSMAADVVSPSPILLAVEMASSPCIWIAFSIERRMSSLCDWEGTLNTRHITAFVIYGD